MTTPHPGSRIDATAQAELAETPGPITETGPEESARIDAVPVAEQAPDAGNFYTWALPVGAFIEILPQDLRRRAARVWTTTAASIVLTHSRDLASQAVTLAAGSGPLATLPANVVLPVGHRDVVYAANVGGAAASVNIAVERDF